MKQIKLFSTALLGLALAFSSCNLNNDDNENYQSFTYSVCNLVIPQNGDAPFAAEDNYVLTYFPYSGNVSVTSSKLSLGVGTTSFTTTQMPYTVKAYGDAAGMYEVTRFAGGKANENGVAITDLSGYTSQMVNVLPPNIASMPGYTFRANPALVMSYVANYDYVIKTFKPDAVYNGKTTIITQGMEGMPYSNENILYRVVFHTDLKSADIIFYNAQFADRMPAINFVVRNLAVTYNKSGYMIGMPQGTQYIVPEMPEGQSGQYTPYESYRFTTFNFNVSDAQLTTGALNFNIEMVANGQVRAQYTGMFSGAYVYSGSESGI